MKAFPWRRGMTAIDEQGGRWLIVDNDGKNWSQCRPDPNDGATKGALLEAVREVYNDPHIGVSYETWIDGQNYWRVGLDYEHPCGRAELGTDPDSEFAALEAAWQAAP